MRFIQFTGANRNDSFSAMIQAALTRF